MIPGVYDFNKHYAGDTFDGIRLTISRTVDGITSPVDLTGADVQFHLNYGAKSGNEILNLSSVVVGGVGGGVTIEDAVNGICRVDPFPIPTTPGMYFHALRVAFSATLVKTYIEGKFPVAERVR